VTDIEKTVLYDALVSSGLPLLRMTNGVLEYTRALNPTEQSTEISILSSIPNLVSTKIRNAAKALLDETRDLMAELLRAIVVRLVSENNILRARFRAQDIAMAQATSFANLQARWATAATANPVPDRTNAQAKQALKDDITNGISSF
jgi:hypothetical protein